MDKIDIFDFLCLKSKDEQKQSMKIWLGLFIAFTIVFMDIGFLLNFSNKQLLICIPILFSLLVFVLLILYFVVCKRISGHISYSILYNASVTTVTAILFYTLFFMYIAAGKSTISIAHIITLSLSLILWLLILIYRHYKFKFNKKKEGRTSYYIIVIPAVLIAVPILKKVLNTFNKSFVLTIAFLLVGGIWMIVSLINWQNYYYGKKINIDKIYYSKNQL